MCITVLSAIVRLQLLTVSSLSPETCAIFLFAFWQNKNIFGRICICRICVWATDYNV